MSARTAACKTFLRRDDAGHAALFDDDPASLSWLAAHPDSFVINTTRTSSTAYLMLHRTTCWTINRLQPQATTFTGDYSKL
jgi:hypothetical protein